MNRTLLDYADEYLAERGVSAIHDRAVRKAVESFGVWLGRPAELRDLDRQPVNEWLASLAAVYGRWALRGYRAKIVALWWAAYDDELCDPPRRIRRIPRPPSMPTSWELEDVGRLLGVAEGLEGTYLRSRTPKRAFWRAYWLVSYDGGFRTFEPFDLKFDTVYQPTFWFAQNKSAKPKLVSLGDAALAALRELEKARDCEYVFRGAISRRYFYDEYRRLRKAAGVSGTGRWLRRTAGTQAEISHPGQGHLLLGNTREVFDRHYNDRTKHGTPPRPPRIAWGCDST